MARQAKEKAITGAGKASLREVVTKAMAEMETIITAAMEAMKLALFLRPSPTSKRCPFYFCSCTWV